MNALQQTDTSEPAPSVIFEKVSLSFENTLLFDQFDLELKPGRCTCILGPSGCGKSTLLKMISASPETVFEGQIKISSSENRPELCSWMSQKDLLLPWMNVIDNIMLGAKLRGEINSQLTKKAEWLLVEAGLEEQLHRLPAVLSGGMRQRVALLRTLMEDRPVLLMDEPFSSLDALTRLKLQDLCAKMTRGKTVILVTHDPMEALRLGETIIILGGTPVAQVASYEPAGSVPRNADSEITSHLYPQLLSTLFSLDNKLSTPKNGLR